MTGQPFRMLSGGNILNWVPPQSSIFISGEVSTLIKIQTVLIHILTGSVNAQQH